MVNVCVPILKRYDLLYELVQSLRESTIEARLHVIDNGCNFERIQWAVGDCAYSLFTPIKPMGVAESWNWFIDRIPEERVIANDDVTFAPDSLEKMVASKADLVWAKDVGFSCFLIRDVCVRKIGLFDETISPGYGYYEDEDYLQRLDGRGTRAASAVAETVVCGVRHEHSATLKVASNGELQEHHRKFKIAQRNYMAKWNISDAEMFGGGQLNQDQRAGVR